MVQSCRRNNFELILKVKRFILSFSILENNFIWSIFFPILELTKGSEGPLEVLTYSEGQGYSKIFRWTVKLRLLEVIAKSAKIFAILEFDAFVFDFRDNVRADSVENSNNSLWRSWESRILISFVRDQFTT